MGNFTFSSPGIWIISYYFATLVSTAPNAVFGIWSYASPYVSGSAPLVTTNNGTAPNINCYASGSWVTNQITTTLTFTMFLNIFSGSLYTNNGACYVVVTRIG
jgi:hypothetical protein